MLSIQQIRDAISELRRHGSIEDFERWLRRESRNVHSWGSVDLVQGVLAVEAVLSEYRFAGLQEGIAKQELAKAIRPFAPIPPVVSYGPRFLYVCDSPTGASSIPNGSVIEFPVGNQEDECFVRAENPSRKPASAIGRLVEQAVVLK